MKTDYRLLAAYAILFLAAIVAFVLMLSVYETIMQ